MYNTDYLKLSHSRAQAQRREFSMHENLQIYIKDEMPDGIDIQSILDKINLAIPSHLTSEVDSIYIGMFAEFEKMETNAMFKDGAIYVTNEQDDEQDLIDDIVHEIAHSLENPFGHLIYADGYLEREFHAKRMRLYEILKTEDLKPSLKMFNDSEYNKEMDAYLYKKVGYDRLNFIASSYGLFTSAYSATALREYFANGFEYFFLDDRSYLAEICPVLYNKIKELHQDD
tara:strand:+ start:5698 stop:6384 length:687 start_codon:yes stop_codon:yes gene_type:complete